MVATEPTASAMTNENFSDEVPASELVISPSPTDTPVESTSRIESNDAVHIGQWYWVKQGDEAESDEWLGCVMHIGSNFVLIEEPSERNCGHRYTRVHFDDVWRYLRIELDVEAIIRERAVHFQVLANRHLDEVKAITSSLGVSEQAALASSTNAAKAGSSLVVLSGTPDVNSYKTALILAKEQHLPALFEAIKAANQEVARWMSAPTLPMMAAARGMEGLIDRINDRIFNVSLYAGLTEGAVLCCDGKPAAFNDKLHVVQRRLYMDEECLLNYQLGGMTFSSIGKFDDWLCVPENRDRILPFPRCLVAMRVRRNGKDREGDGTLRTELINLSLKEADKLTFLYVRNGEQVHRLDCALEFDELIFPDKATLNLDEPMMVRMRGHQIDQMITRADYDSRCDELTLKQAAAAQWNINNPKKTWDSKTQGPRQFRDPERESYNWHRPDEWRPFDPTNVYFDECSKHIDEQIKKFNRIAVIIQGLFDRSATLHPHPPVQSWTPEGFAAAIKLIYDGSNVLHHGEAPDFEMYRAKCNESLTADSVVIGQQRFFVQRETEKEHARLDSDWRNRSDYRPSEFHPRGNDGPGYLAKMAAWKGRSRQAVFAWHRERQTSDPYMGKRYGDAIRTSITVPAAQLFNVSGYTPGDYKQFFRDSRTRAKYLQWAPMLLAAEEYYAGNIKPQEPI